MPFLAGKLKMGAAWIEMSIFFFKNALDLVKQFASIHPTNFHNKI